MPPLPQTGDAVPGDAVLGDSVPPQAARAPQRGRDIDLFFYKDLDDAELEIPDPDSFLLDGLVDGSPFVSDSPAPPASAELARWYENAERDLSRSRAFGDAAPMGATDPVMVSACQRVVPRILESVGFVTDATTYFCRDGEGSGVNPAGLAVSVVLECMTPMRRGFGAPWTAVRKLLEKRYPASCGPLIELFSGPSPTLAAEFRLQSIGTRWAKNRIGQLLVTAEGRRVWGFRLKL